jgi:hypothetical protein
MKQTKRIKLLYPVWVIVGLCSCLTGCRNTDFDLSHIDTTLGIGGDSITLPDNNSTDSIMLDDVLKLKNSDYVKIMDNGDYVFGKSDDNIQAAHPSINTIVIKQMSSTPNVLSVFSVTNMAKMRRKAAASTMSFGGTVYSFEYSTSDFSKDILQLNKVYTTMKLSLSLSFSDELQRIIQSMNTITISLPKFFGDVTPIVNGKQVTVNENNQIVLDHISTAQNLTLTVAVKTLDFEATGLQDDECLSFVEGKNINLKGKISVSGSFDTPTTTPTNPSECKITSSTSNGDVYVTGATGKFAPKIDFDNIGTVNLNGTSNFLNDSDVVVDLYNPQIILNIASDLPVDGFVKGVITAKSDGQADVNVDIPRFKIKGNTDGDGNTMTKVCLCRNTDAVTGTYDEVVEVPTLSDVIKRVPKSVTFDHVTAEADGSQTGTLTFGKTYTVQPTYELIAPLAFSKDAKIIYRDTLDGWNNDVKDLQIENALVITADVTNRIPVYLKAEVLAIDANKQPLSNDDISISVQPTIPAYDPAAGENRRGEAHCHNQAVKG